jgi:replicative DNA helicase
MELDTIHLLDDELFYSGLNKRIFNTIKDMVEKDKKVDVLLLAQQFEGDDSVPMSYIAGLLDGVSKSEKKNITAYVDQLRELANKRKMSILVHNIDNSLYDGNGERTHKLIEELKHLGVGKKNADTISADELIKGFEDYRSRGCGIKIGIPSFDGASEGIAEGEVAYLIARAKVIKSVFIQNVFRYFSRHYPQHGGVFFSLEMSPPQLGERLLMIESGKAYQDITEEDKDDMIKRHKNIFYITTPALSLQDIYNTISKLKYKSDIKFVAIDFLTRIKTNVQGEYEFLRTATKFIKDMAKELNIVVFVISQVGREYGEDGSVPLSLRSGRGSGTIEEDADFIFGAYRPELSPNISPARRDKYKDKVILQTLGARRIPKLHDIVLHFDKRNLRIKEVGFDEIRKSN